ncbi:MAG: cytochrome c oxidase assembly protein, partial [Geminicoccaceae bacterium]
MTETWRRTHAHPHLFRREAALLIGGPLMLASSPVAAASWDGSFDPWLSLCLATKPPLTPETVWSSWSFAPEIVVPLLALLGWYLWRVTPWAETQRAGRTGAFATGWLLLALALTSPLCRAAATLASAHMVQHAVLVALAPSLLVLGLPRRVLGRLVARIASARWSASLGLAYAAVIWLAHAPAIYESALSNRAAHLALIVVLLGTGCAFWAAVLGDSRSGPACASGAALCFTA